jgi:hypothetical protein
MNIRFLGMTTRSSTNSFAPHLEQSNRKISRTWLPVETHLVLPKGIQ